MITILALAIASAQATSDVSEFFPVTPGTKWVYQETIKVGKNPAVINTYTDIAGTPEPVGEMTGIPIATQGSGDTAAQVAHYNISGDSVDTVFTYTTKVIDADKNVDTSNQNGGIAGGVRFKTETSLVSFPVLKVGSGKTEWTYSGKTLFVGDPVDTIMNSESRHTGKKTYLGKSVETVEVKTTQYINAVPDDGFAGLKNATIKIESTAVYASGIGLVELKEQAEVGKTKQERNLKLVSFAPGS